MVQTSTSFDSLRIGLASTDKIKLWSYGEVTKPETINYRTLRPEKEDCFVKKSLDPPRIGNVTAESIRKYDIEVLFAIDAELK